MSCDIVIIPCRDGGRFRETQKRAKRRLNLRVIIPCRDGGRFRDALTSAIADLA